MSGVWQPRVWTLVLAATCIECARTMTEQRADELRWAVSEARRMGRPEAVAEFGALRAQALDEAATLADRWEALLDEAWAADARIRAARQEEELAEVAD